MNYNDFEKWLEDIEYSAYAYFSQDLNEVTDLYDLDLQDLFDRGYSKGMVLDMIEELINESFGEE
jgi:hypothetical protein